jgi:Major Facilitator Superfamily
MKPNQLVRGRREDADLRTARELSPAALALVLVAAFVVLLDFSIVNVALWSIEQELGFSATSLPWVVTAYAITFGGLLILGGGAADRFGRRRMFLVGLLVFTAASLAGGLASGPRLLVAARASRASARRSSLRRPSPWSRRAFARARHEIAPSASMAPPPQWASSPV